MQKDSTWWRNQSKGSSNSKHAQKAAEEIAATFYHRKKKKKKKKITVLDTRTGDYCSQGCVPYTLSHQRCQLIKSGSSNT